MRLRTVAVHYGNPYIMLKMHKFTLVGQGGGMTAAYHIGVIMALSQKYPREIKNLDKIIASSGAAAIYSYFVSGQVELMKPIMDYLFDSKLFVVPKRWPPGKHMMDIDFLVDHVLKETFPLDVNSLIKSPTQFEVGVTEAHSGKTEYFKKDSPQIPDIFELIRATCMVPYFSGDAISLSHNMLGHRLYLDGTIGSIASLEQVKSDQNVLLVLTRPLNEPVPQHIGLRKMAAWLLMKKMTQELQQAIWDLMTQQTNLSETVEDLKRTKNIAIIEPSEPLPMWRIEVRPNGKERMHRVIEQGYNDALSNPSLKNFFAKV